MIEFFSVQNTLLTSLLWKMSKWWWEEFVIQALNNNNNNWKTCKRTQISSLTDKTLARGEINADSNNNNIRSYWTFTTTTKETYLSSRFIFAPKLPRMGNNWKQLKQPVIFSRKLNFFKNSLSLALFFARFLAPESSSITRPLNHIEFN